MTRTTETHDARHGPATPDEYQRLVRRIDDLCQKLMLPQGIRLRAVAIGCDAATVGFRRRFSDPVLAAASLYVAGRQRKNPTTLRDVAVISGSESREVGKCYLLMLEKMHISRPDLNGRRYVFHLDLKRAVSEESMRVSQELIRKAFSKGLGGRNPMTLAAASLYLACCSMGERVTQAEVAEAAGVGEESVRECCKAMRAVTHLADRG